MTSPAEFLAGLPAERARELRLVRTALRKHIPAGYEEAVVKNMIVFQVPLSVYPDTYNRQPLWLAALGAPKSYLTLHLLPVYGHKEMEQRLRHGFTAAGKKLDIGKACIRFKAADDLDLDTIGQIVASLPVDKWVGIARTAWRR